MMKRKECRTMSDYMTAYRENFERIGIEDGKILGRIDTLQEMGWSQTEILENIQEKFGLTPFEAQANLVKSQRSCSD